MDSIEKARLFFQLSPGSAPARARGKGRRPAAGLRDGLWLRGGNLGGKKSAGDGTVEERASALGRRGDGRGALPRGARKR
jgi:hypothetical protein